MARQLVSEQTTTEYFKELVEEALTERHLQAGDLTEYYLVNLLCQYVRPDSRADHLEQAEPLAFRLGRALETGGSEQRARLRSLGDFSLFMSGFFSDSFRRSLVDVDYYKSMGEYAYGSLSRSEHDTFAQVFAELSSKFVGFMDVLSHISERTATTHASEDGHPPPLREVAADRQRARRPAAGRARAAPEPVDRSPVRSVDQPTRRSGRWDFRDDPNVRKCASASARPYSGSATRCPTNARQPGGTRCRREGSRLTCGRHDVGASPPRLWRMCHLTISREDRTKPRIR